MAARGEPDSTPICRCRVLYLGSAVPHVTKDGLQGIQEPLKELYPEQGAIGAKGIDSWLSVWSNGMLLENVDENHKKVTRFFPIETLHYCAAVRYVLVPGHGGEKTPRFLPLDSPFARNPNINHPPLFASILRRTTGIKVLECHAFICKREMAANALVRCCFHAYADSSYARHMEGSVYGTLRSQSKGGQSVISEPVTSIEKVEGWRMSPGASSTPNGQAHQHDLVQNGVLTAVDNSAADEISIYNGDENHKVWAGSTSPDKDGIYGEYASTLRSAKSSTLGTSRSNRPRQIMMPSKPPPPPEDEDDKKKGKDKGKKKNRDRGSREEYYPIPMNGSLMRPMSAMNGRSSSSLSGTLMKGGVMPNGTLMRPSSQMNGYGPPLVLVTPPHHQGRPMRRMVAGTYSHRPRGMVPRSIPSPFLIPPHGAPMPPHGAPMSPHGAPMPPHGGPMPPHGAPMPPPAIMTAMPMSKKGKPQPIPMEEPIYMPSARPLSPVASYQPGHFPHEAYLMQHYATTDNKYQRKKKKSTGSKKGDESSTDSPFNTGIYRKKGHLNERAFSYSIRQEHRSRSYGSLANLKFANGDSAVGMKEDIKKEREIMQMMQDLDISGDELERSEVPAAVYENRRPASRR